MHLGEHPDVRPALVDVLIPVYDGAATIEASLRSLQAQTLQDVRLLVIDDGSTDGTLDIVRRLAAEDRRIVVLERRNGGIVDALNAGLAETRAEFVARLDADDLSHPDRLERQVDYLTSTPDCVAVSGAVRHIDGAGGVLKSEVHLASPDSADPCSYPQVAPYLVHPFLMARRAAMTAVGGYRHVFHAEDTDLYWRLAETGRLVNLDAVLGDYRMHAGSITSSSIVNGRIAAVTSQRSGISAQRRRTGRPDLEFHAEDLAAYQEAHTLEGMVAVGARGLDEQEARRLALSASVKLLELAGYRPFELDAQDAAFVRRTWSRQSSDMSAADRRLCTRMLSGTAARLLHHGHAASALRLAPPRTWSTVAVRYVARAAMPPGVRTLLQRATGRELSFVK